MKKVIVLLVTFSMFILFYGVSIEADEKEKSYAVTAHYIYNNEPRFSVQLQAKNYQKAYQKLRTGNLTKEELSHFSFNDLKKTYPYNDKKIYVSDTLYFGEGVKISKENAKKLVLDLYKTNSSFLDMINDYKNPIYLVTPENKNYQFTNKDGISVGKVPKGITILINSAEPKNILIHDVQKPSIFYLGNTNRKLKPVISESKTKNNFSTDNGNTVSYRIPIKNEKEIRISVTPNFQIDSINASYTRKDVYKSKRKIKDGIFESKNKNIIEETNQVTYQKKESESEADMLEEIGIQLSKLYASEELTVDTSDLTDDFLVVKGHVSSKKEHSVTIKYLDEKNISQGEQILSRRIPVYSHGNEQGIIVSDENGIYSKTPFVNSYSINFASFDPQTNNLIRDVEYSLVRKDKDNNLSVYHPSKGEWIGIESLKDIQKQDIQNISINGGKYYYTDGYQREIPLNKKLWNFDIDKLKSENASLFKIRGLSSEFKYQLFPIKVPKGYSISKTASHYFYSVSQKSLKQAQTPNYKINGQIIGMEYKANEFNALPILKKQTDYKKNINPYMMIGFIFLFMILSSVATGLILIKKY